MTTPQQTTVESLPTPTDSVNSIRRSSINFFSGTALSRITGFLRDICFAFSFGTNEALAAFFIAFRLAHITRRLFGEGALQAAFVPLFEEIRQESIQHGCRFFRDLYAVWILLISFFCLVGVTGLLAWSQLVQTTPSVQEIIDLTVIILPSLLPICLFGLNVSFLQCQKQYFTAGIAPIFFNIVLIVSTLFLGQYTPTTVMPLCAFSVILACLAQWLASFIPVYQQCRKVLGKELFSSIAIFSPIVRRIWKPISLGIVGIGATQINNAVDLLFARAADPEGPALLWYAIRFQQLPLALFGIALSSAILPPLARAIQSNNPEQYLSFLDYAIRKVIAFLVPCTGALLILGMAMINLLYGHGDFSKHSVIATTSCLHGYALSLVPMGLIIIFANAFYAKKNYIVPMRGAYLSLVSNLVLNTIMIYGFGWKALSVCLATSISSWLNAFYLYATLQKETGTLLSPAGKINGLKITASVIVSSVLCYITISCFFSPPVVFNTFASHVSLPNNLTDQIIQLVYPSIFFGVSLFAFAVMLRADDLIGIVYLALKRTKSVKT